MTGGAENGRARGTGAVAGHVDELADAIGPFRAWLPRITGWGRRLADALSAGGRLLVAGNGGSAAQSIHLAAELVGRYSSDRRGYSALALPADPAACTAIGNDFGAAEVFARQVEAHGRPGDILMLLSTSGTSQNVLSAAATGNRAGLTTWALTGPAPNPLADRCDEAVCVAAAGTATTQELHLLALHLVCEAADEVLVPDRVGVTSGAGAGR